jgi:4-carboxymuconolactone decarboxylase
MYLPKTFENFSKNYPEIVEHYDKLGSICRNAGPLDNKSQDLIKLGIAIGVNSRGAVMSAVRKALASQASPEEINHAILLSITTTGFPNMIAAMGWAQEVLDKQ